MDLIRLTLAPLSIFGTLFGPLVGTGGIPPGTLDLTTTGADLHCGKIEVLAPFWSERSHCRVHPKSTLCVIVENPGSRWRPLFVLGAFCADIILTRLNSTIKPGSDLVTKAIVAALLLEIHRSSASNATGTGTLEAHWTFTSGA